MTTSLNGWAYPAKKIVRMAVPGTTRSLNVNADCATLLVAVAADYHKFVRPIDIGTVDDASFADRDARAAAGRKSNHSNGTAIDLNYSEEGAQNSGWGKKFFATAKTKAAVLIIKKRYASCIQWGGDWKSVQDYMHWEIKPGATKDDVAALCKKLKINAKGVRGGA